MTIGYAVESAGWGAPAVWLSTPLGAAAARGSHGQPQAGLPAVQRRAVDGAATRWSQAHLWLRHAAFLPHAREETPESRGMPCLFLNTKRGFGGKPPKKLGFRRHLAGSKMPKETFFTAISRWRVVSRRALDASGLWQG